MSNLKLESRSSMQLNEPRYGNVEIANAISRNEHSELYNSVKSTLQAIVGKVDIPKSSAKLLEQKMSRFEIDVARKVLRYGIKNAGKSYGATPSEEFWDNAISDVMRSDRLGRSELSFSYKDVTEEERVNVARIAREAAERFGVNKHVEKNNPLANKMRRYREYAKRDEVRIDQYGHELNNQWIMRKQAESMGLKYHCPVEWLKLKGVESKCPTEWTKTKESN